MLNKNIRDQQKLLNIMLSKSGYEGGLGPIEGQNANLLNFDGSESKSRTGEQGFSRVIFSEGHERMDERPQCKHSI